MDIIKFFVAVDGDAQLWAVNGQFLGLLSSNQNDFNSIINPNTYGSCYSYSSIQNPACIYGGSSGLYSPYNLSCVNPPVIVYQEQRVLVVTRNTSLIDNELPVVDPDLVLGVYTRRTIAKFDAVAM